MKPYITALTGTILVLTVLCVFAGCSDKDIRPTAALDGNKNSKLKSFDTISPEEIIQNKHCESFYSGVLNGL